MEATGEAAQDPQPQEKESQSTGWKGAQGGQQEWEEVEGTPFLPPPGLAAMTEADVERTNARSQGKAGEGGGGHAARWALVGFRGAQEVPQREGQRARATRPHLSDDALSVLIDLLSDHIHNLHPLRHLQHTTGRKDRQAQSPAQPAREGLG